MTKYQSRDLRQRPKTGFFLRWLLKEPFQLNGSTKHRFKIVLETSVRGMNNFFF